MERKVICEREPFHHDPIERSLPHLPPASRVLQNIRPSDVTELRDLIDMSVLFLSRTATHLFTLLFVRDFIFCLTNIYFFKERLGHDSPREDSIEMLCLPLRYRNPGKGCRGNQSEWWSMVLKLT